jgi:hypothetical protein
MATQWRSTAITFMSSTLVAHLRWSIEMDTIAVTPGPTADFELRFPSLFDPGRALAFPCNADGEVELERLSERGRSSYLRARDRVGREYAFPTVRVSQLH